MDSGLKGMGKKKNYYETNEIVVTVSNSRSLKSKINMIGRSIREQLKEMNNNAGHFVKDMIRHGRFEMYIKLLKINRNEKETTDYIYQVDSSIKEQRNLSKEQKAMV